MLKFVFIIAVYCASAQGIRGGRNTDISDHPWQVAIFHLNALRCGGSLISPDWVLTSCRCLCYPLSRTLLPTREMYLVVGSTNISQGVTYGVNTTITYEEWDSGQLNDIGLIRTTASIVEDYAKPVTLPCVTYWLNVGTEVSVTGWGKMGPGGDYAEVLQEFIFNVEDNTICEEGFYQNESIINDNMFCGGVDSCYGDLGGPAVVDGMLVGVISQGADCYFTEKPGMYQLVGSFRMAQVPARTLEQCRSCYTQTFVTDNMFCAGYVNLGNINRTSCDGDYGGPGMVQGWLTGIQSWGRSCGIQRYPTVFVKVINFVPWITQISGIPA